MPKVSVLMPVYNTEESYFKEAINSILEQSFSNFELIIVNDGSTNNIDSIVSAYTDSRIIYLKQRHSGIGKARNLLLDSAKGEYIAWMDSDDISELNRLEKQVKFLDENPDVDIVGGAVRMFNEKNLNRIEIPNYFPGYLDSGSYTGSKMIRLNTINKYNFRFNESMTTSEDSEFFMRFRKIAVEKNISDVVLNYRIRKTSNSHSKEFSNHGVMNRSKIVNGYISFLSNNPKKINIIKKLLNYDQLSFWEKIFSVTKVVTKLGVAKRITILGISYNFKIILPIEDYSID